MRATKATIGLLITISLIVLLFVAATNNEEITYKSKLISQDKETIKLGIESDDGYFMMVFYGEHPIIPPNTDILVHCRFSGCYIPHLQLPPIPTLPPFPVTPFPHPTFQPSPTPTP